MASRYSGFYPTKRRRRRRHDILEDLKEAEHKDLRRSLCGRLTHWPVCRPDLIRPNGLILATAAPHTIALRRMFLVVTLEIALAPEESLVFKFQSPCVGVGRYYGNVKIDEIAVVRGVALVETDAVGIVTHRTRRFFIFNMSLVFAEALVLEDTLTIVTAVT